VCDQTVIKIASLIKWLFISSVLHAVQPVKYMLTQYHQVHTRYVIQLVSYEYVCVHV
jgi:hypothetical protein